MKRIFLLALATVMLLVSATAFSSCGDDVTDTTTTVNTMEEEEESLSFALNTNGISYRVTGIGTYKDTDVVIPNTYKSLPVTEIADGAFEGCTTITGVTVPYGIITIGEKSFRGCTSLKEINISLEICSESPGFNNNYPSDITFSINGIEICTFISQGDYGDRYGKFTPSWWYPERTKYGILTNISIRSSGVFLNERLVNKGVCLQDLRLPESNKTTFGIEVKKNAHHPGGFNIFGSQFGDYAQHIIFTATYK